MYPRVLYQVSHIAVPDARAVGFRIQQCRVIRHHSCQPPPQNSAQCGRDVCQSHRGIVMCGRTPPWSLQCDPGATEVHFPAEEPFSFEFLTHGQYYAFTAWTLSVRCADLAEQQRTATTTGPRELGCEAVRGGHVGHPVQLGVSHSQAVEQALVHPHQLQCFGEDVVLGTALEELPEGLGDGLNGVQHRLYHLRELVVPGLHPCHQGLGVPGHLGVDQQNPVAGDAAGVPRGCGTKKKSKE